MGSFFTSLFPFFSLLAFLITLASADVPQVDFARMGVVALAGSFAGLDFYTANPRTTFDSTTSTLLSRAANGTISYLASTNPGGSVTSVCALGESIYVAGNFTSLSGTPYSNIAAYDLTLNRFSALQSGLDNTVYALYCNSSAGTVWAGGSFNSPLNANVTRFGGSVAVFNTSDHLWCAPGFSGFSGGLATVKSITPGIGNSSTSLYFGGSFNLTYISNGTQTNATNNPMVPYSPGATPFSTSLVPLPLAVSDIAVAPVTNETGFSNIGNILCPTGNALNGSTWFGATNRVTQLSIRTTKFTNARGIRLGNSFFTNRATTSFRVTTLPTNEVVALTYVNPTTRVNETCSSSCPLLHDPTVPFQDFLFPDSVITGIQLSLLTWNGTSSGLRLLQLLSDGAFGSAISGNNARSCYSPDASGTYETGYWNLINAVVPVPGSTQQMVSTKIPVGTQPAYAPMLNWLPYVSAAGTYDIYVYVPGCTQFGDCAKRTNVDITVFPGGGAVPIVKTISERVTNDTRVLVHSGYIIPTPPAYSVTIRLSLAQNATSVPLNGTNATTYSIVADRVQLQLTSLPNGLNGQAAPWGTIPPSDGFGFYEWNTGLKRVNATGSLSNYTETTFDASSTVFAKSLSPGAIVNAVVPASENTLFIGGSFNTSGGYQNIVYFSNRTVLPLASLGLNGTVDALAYQDGFVYVGGSFNGLAFNDTTRGYRNIAKYDVQKNSWSQLGGGLNGPVASLYITKGQLLVGGNFSESYSQVDSFGVSVGGVATWSLDMSKWVSGGSLILGTSSLAAAPGSGDTQFIAGNIGAVSGHSAPGWAIISDDAKTGAPSIGAIAAPLAGPAAAFELQGATGSNSEPISNSGPSPARHKHYKNKTHHGRSGFIDWIMPRAAKSSMRTRQTIAPIPEDPPAPAPAVLAVAFWTNQTNSKQAIILGGNFTFIANGSSSASTSLALFDRDTQSLGALKGAPVDGIVKVLLVLDHYIYVGGNFTAGPFTGFAIYDVNTLDWRTDFAILSSSDGSNVVIRSITNPPNKVNSIVVGGSFTAAGLTACNAICIFDSGSSQWSALGSGIQGEVTSVDYGKDDSDVLIAAGSLMLQDGSMANVAKYFFSNSTWAAVGTGIPGPVTAVSVNDGHVNSIFAAGRSSDSSAPFMLHWDGSAWNPMGETLNANTVVSQLQMVPRVHTQDDNNIVQGDRVLMASGSLFGSFGNVSTALYDGKAWYPYITSTTSTGGFGVMSGLFHSFAKFSFSARHFLSTGIVILISIAISAGIVFFLLLIGVLWTLFSRDPPPEEDHKEYEEIEDDSLHRPSSLLENINAATRSTIAGGAVAGGAGAAVAGRNSSEPLNRSGPDGEYDDQDDSGWRRAETPAATATAGAMASDGEHETGRPAFARYSFDGEGEGEMPLQAGAQLSVLDDRDAAWWYVRNEQTHQEGIVPAAYLY